MVQACVWTRSMIVPPAETSWSSEPANTEAILPKLPKMTDQSSLQAKVGQQIITKLQFMESSRFRNPLFIFLRFLWWGLQNPFQSLPSCTPEILHIIIRPSLQIRRNFRPFVPKLCL